MISSLYDDKNFLLASRSGYQPFLSPIHEGHSVTTAVELFSGVCTFSQWNRSPEDSGKGQSSTVISSQLVCDEWATTGSILKAQVRQGPSTPKGLMVNLLEDEMID